MTSSCELQVDRFLTPASPIHVLAGLSYRF